MPRTPLPTAQGPAPPPLGLGTWRLWGERLARAVEAAIAAGYRHFDTAASYRNERDLGRALAASGLPRHELYVTSKISNHDQGGGRSRSAVLAALERLGLESLDLCLLHWPVSGRTARGWEELESLVDEGLIRAAGVSNFEEGQLARLLAEGSLKPLVNQLEIHPHRTREGLAAFCRQRGVMVTAHSPLARGSLNRSRNLAAIAERLGRSVPQVILRWHLQKGRGVIPKSGDPARILENSRILDFELPEADVRILDRQNQDRSVLKWRFRTDAEGYVIDEGPEGSSQAE